MRQNNVDRLLNEFRKAAISCGAAITEGQTRAANKSTKRLEQTRRELAACGQDSALLDLLYDEDEWIQVYAAIAMLERAETIAMEKLREIATRGEPLPSLEARTAMLVRGAEPDGRGTHEHGASGKSSRENDTPGLMREMPLPEAVENVKCLLAKAVRIPRTIRFSEIEHLETMEDRFFAVDRIVGSVLGMNADSIDFCPGSDPPTTDEVLAWLWVTHPECKAGILEFGSDRIRRAVFESKLEE